MVKIPLSSELEYLFSRKNAKCNPVFAPLTTTLILRYDNISEYDNIVSFGCHVRVRFLSLVRYLDARDRRCNFTAHRGIT